MKPALFRRKGTDGLENKESNCKRSRKNSGFRDLEGDPERSKYLERSRGLERERGIRKGADIDEEKERT
jgi:hypothetical protein